MIGELARLEALSDKVDAFFSRVASRTALACRPGCAACCVPGLGVTRVEADRLRAHLAGLAAERRDELRARARRGDPARCVALEPDGRCGVYEARPLVCRSHGVPVRVRDGRGLPVVGACELNFGPEALAGVADADVLDQATLSTVLGAIELAHARALGVPPAREALADVLAG